MRARHPRVRARRGSWSCLVALLAGSAQSRRAMTVDDVIDLVQVSAPRISPDGRRVLYTVSELGKWKDNKRVTSIWIADADGANARRFLAQRKRSRRGLVARRPLRWRSCRRAMPPTRDATATRPTATAQIYVIPVDGGEACEADRSQGQHSRLRVDERQRRRSCFSPSTRKPTRRRPRRRRATTRSSSTKGANGQERGRIQRAMARRDRRQDRTADHQRRHAAGRRLPACRPTARRSRSSIAARTRATVSTTPRSPSVDATSGAIKTLTQNNAPETERAMVARREDAFLSGAERHVVGSGRREAVGGAGRRRRRAAQADRIVQRRHRAVRLGARRPVDRLRRRDPRARRRSTASAWRRARSRRSPAATGRAGWNRYRPTRKRGVAVVSTPTAPGEVERRSI